MMMRRIVRIPLVFTQYKPCVQYLEYNHNTYIIRAQYVRNTITINLGENTMEFGRNSHPIPNQLTSEALKRTAFRSPQALASWKRIFPKQRCSPAVPAVSAVSALYGSPKLGDPNCRHHVIAQLFYSLWGRKQCSAPARVFTHVLCRCGE